jgi:perosamine synthetase
LMDDGLAVLGGAPVRATMLPYGRQSIEEEDVDAVVEALRSDWLTTGPRVAEFEQALAQTVGVRETVAVANGTAALHAAVAAAGIGPDDEVIVTPLTFAASANCVRYVGATVKFADVREDTLTLDPERVEAEITNRTKAIITVDYAGQPSDLDPLMELARAHNLVLIEDAAHSLGASYGERPVGSVAHLTTFSFHPVKLITTGEGGAVATDDTELAVRLRNFRNHGITTDHREREATGSWFYSMEDLGYNYRISDLQCALGTSQLRRLATWIEARSRIAARYDAAFTDLPEIRTPTIQSDRTSAWHLYVVRLESELLRSGRKEVFQALRGENIGVNVHYIPVPHHPYYRSLGYEPGTWPVSESAYERMLSLPIFPGMTDGDVDDVVAAVRKVIAAYRV